MVESDMRVLLQGIVGSTAYGMAGPDSDIDQYGVFAYDTARLFELTPPPQSHVSKSPDIQLHEAGKYVRLALSGNPTVTELMYLEQYEQLAPLGAELIGIRHAFLCGPRVRGAYFGYATQQFRKLLSRGDGSFSSDTRKRTAKHARHLKRLVEQGYELYTTGTLTVRLAEPETFLRFGEQVAEDSAAAVTFMAHAEEKFAAARTVLPEEPDEAPVQDWINRVRAAYYTPAEPADA